MPEVDESAPDTDAIAIIAVSDPSLTVSEVGLKVAVPSVCPAEIVIAVIAPKSVPGVAVPVWSDIATVISSSAATVEVAVNVIFEPLSKTVVAVEPKDTVGALSFSLIVKVTACGVEFSVAPPPETVSIAIIPVSFHS